MPFSNGDRVVLRKLRARPEFNGEEAIVLDDVVPVRVGRVLDIIRDAVHTLASNRRRNRMLPSEQFDAMPPTQRGLLFLDPLDGRHQEWEKAIV